MKLFLKCIGVLAFIIVLSGCNKCKKLDEKECNLNPECTTTEQPCPPGAFGCAEGDNMFAECIPKN